MIEFLEKFPEKVQDSDCCKLYEFGYVLIGRIFSLGILLVLQDFQ